MLLGLLVVIWAVSWPVIKIGVAAVSPIWYACLRYLIATGCLFALVAVRGEFVVPSRWDWRLVAVSGVFQMGAYSALTGLALTILPPGRASVLAFSTPLWVVPLAAWWLREPVSTRSRYGVGFGLLGVLVIASPALQRHGGGQFASYAMLMSAAAAWAISIVFVRAHRFDSSPLALAPWQALVAVVLLAPLAAMIEGAPRALDWRGVASLAYVGPVATAFAYWAIVEVGRELRASTISMALLATPSLGLLISTLTLGERVSGSLATGVLLVGAGIRLATSNPSIRSRASEQSA
ncbi:MAG TPA: DMT family transporter [Gemmatimonadaceae bacterium]|nr:DMT family transporter [Gemmatimonadaceae bacterium]